MVDAGKKESSILGAVLAGGRSRRMGRDKALLPFGGLPLVRRAAQVLQQVSGEVVVVSPRRQALDELDMPLIEDRFVDAGPLAGVHAALVHGGGRPVFVLACDLPFVTAELVRHVASYEAPCVPARAGSAGGVTTRTIEAQIPVLEGRAQPLCGLYLPGCLAALESYLRDGHRRASGFLATIAIVEVPIEPRLPFVEEDPFVNLNEPQDLARAEARVRRGG